MPLTLELYGSDESKSAHIIFDRNRIIIAFKATSGSQYLKDALVNNFETSISALDEYDQIQTFRAFDPAHAVYEHMCEYDRNALHTHFAFRQDITADLIKKIFSGIHFDKCSNVFSKECANEIIDVATNYFHEITHSAKSIDANADYLKDKETQALDLEKNRARQSKVYNKKGPHLWSSPDNSIFRIAIQIFEEDDSLSCRVS